MQTVSLQHQLSSSEKNNIYIQLTHIYPIAVIHPIQSSFPFSPISFQASLTINCFGASLAAASTSVTYLGRWMDGGDQLRWVVLMP